MRNLSRRLERLEAILQLSVNGTGNHCRELIERLSFEEREVLKDALTNFKCHTATVEDHEIIRSIFKLAQERFDAGLIIVRERKPPEQWNEEMREALRLQRDTGQPWRSIGNYFEFFVEASEV